MHDFFLATAKICFNILLLLFLKGTCALLDSQSKVGLEQRFTRIYLPCILKQVKRQQVRWCFTKGQRLQSEARNLTTSRCNHRVFILISHPINPSQTQYIMIILCRGAVKILFIAPILNKHFQKGNHSHAISYQDIRWNLAAPRSLQFLQLQREERQMEHLFKFIWLSQPWYCILLPLLQPFYRVVTVQLLHLT